MDAIRCCLGMRFGALGPYLVLELHYYVTETLQLDVAVSYELGLFNCCHGYVDALISPDLQKPRSMGSFVLKKVRHHC